MEKGKYKRTVSRRIQAYARDLRDGCLECRAVRGVCFDHARKLTELALDPKLIDGFEKELQGSGEDKP